MIVKSPFPDVEIPDLPLTKFVFQTAHERADKVAFIEGLSGRRLTYGHLVENIRRAAAGLSIRGLSKGDVLAIYSPNLPEYAVAFHAASTLGAVTTTINPLSTPEEVVKQLRDARVRALVTIPELADKAKEAMRDAGVSELLVFGEALDGADSFSSLLEGDAEPPDVSIDAEDLVALPYSSGTTGGPKGVMLTHRNLVANLLQIEGTNHAKESDTLVCVLPMFHIYGLTVILCFGLYVGATIVTLPRFDFELLLKTMQDHKVTMAHLVPPIILALAKSPVVDGYDLSSLKRIFSGAAPLGEHVQRECSKRLNVFINQGYGMTETSPATHVTPYDPARPLYGAVGAPVANTECKIVDLETGAELDANSEGEICLRGPQVMKGYLNRPDATAETIDADGWLHTGDIGYADEEGAFYIVDRAKELIKYKGFQVAPAELEALLLTHPSVADAAVIPSPDEEAGEIPKAFVVLKQGEEATGEELISHVASRVAPYKKIRLIQFIEQIPKSPSGKILRRVLVEKERERANES